MKFTSTLFLLLPGIAGSLLCTSLTASGLPQFFSHGSSHYIVLSTGELWGWGDVRRETFGGVDTAGFYWSPERLTNSVTAIWTYGQTTLLLKDDQSLWAFGEDSFGWYSQAHTHVSQPVQIASGVIDADISRSHILFLKEDGSLWGIGEYDDGELGAAAFGQGLPRPTYLEPAHIADAVTHLAAGMDSTYFITEDLALWGLGKNRVIDDESGLGLSALGLADSTTASFKTPQLITQNTIAVDAGNDFVLILKADQTLWAAGNAAYGAAGAISGNSMNGLRELQENVDWMNVDVTTGGGEPARSTVALIKADGSVWVQGYFYQAESQPFLQEPLKIVDQAADIEAASGAVVAILPDGRAVGVGNGATGLLGPAYGGFSSDLVQVEDGVTRIWSAPTADGALIVERTDGSVWAYGEPTSNRFGTPLETGASPNLYKIASGGVQKAGSARDVGILLFDDGSLWAAGRLGFGSSNSFRHLAGGATDFSISLATLYFTTADQRLQSVNFGMSPREEAVDVARIWSEIYYPAFMTIAEKSDGSTLRFGTPGPIHQSPAFSLNGSNLLDKEGNIISTDVVAYAQAPSGSGVLYLKSDGNAWGLSPAGNNFGELGTGDTGYVAEPLWILEDVVDVGATSGTFYLLTSGGTLWGAGLGDLGQLGAAISVVATHPIDLLLPGATPAQSLGGTQLEENWLWTNSLAYVSTHYWPWAWSSSYGWLYVMDADQPLGYGKYFYSDLLEGWAYFPSDMHEWFYLWNGDGASWHFFYAPWLAVYRVPDGGGEPEFVVILKP